MPVNDRWDSTWRLKVLNGNFYTTRPVGRPRNRWADVVQRDALQLLGITGWRSRAEKGMNGGVLWGRRRTGRGCSVLHGMEWNCTINGTVTTMNKVTL